jgi:hypothetical protein
VTQRTNISLRTRVFPLLNKRKNGNFSHAKKKKMPTTTRRTPLLQRGALSAAKRFYTRGGSGGATTNKSIVSSSFAKNPDAAEAVPLLVFVSAGLFCFVSEYFLTS